jgi:HlyD family secretion protein
MLTGILTFPATRALARGAQPYGADLIKFGLIFMLSAPALATLSPVLAAEAAATIAPSGLRITVAQANRRCFTETLETAGRFVAREEILVRPEIEGLRISQVLVETGDRVTEGQVLARLSRGEGHSGPLPSAATIKAPAAGVISYRAAQVHVAATVRGEPLFRLIVGGEVELQAEVPARRLSKLAPGQSASVEISGGGEISGHVRSVSSAVDQRTQMGSARIFLGEQGLPIGAFAKAVVVVGESCGSSVPLSAVIYDTDGAIVQVVRDNRIETRRVQVGLLSNGSVEIRDGLTDGELVVARSGAFLREGDPVRPVVAKEPQSSNPR